MWPIPTIISQVPKYNCDYTQMIDAGITRISTQQTNVCYIMSDTCQQVHHISNEPHY